MKKLTALLFGFFLAFTLQAQHVSDDSIASYINTNIIPNAANSITATMVNHSLDILNSSKLNKDSIAEISWKGDTLFLTDKYNVTDTFVVNTSTPNWTLTGDDLENANAGKVTIADTANLDGEVFMENLTAESKVGYVLAWFPTAGATKGKVYPVLFQTALDTANRDAAASPGDYSTWVRDTTNNELYPANIADQVGIGTADPTKALEVVGNILVGAANNQIQLKDTDDGTLWTFNQNGGELVWRYDATNKSPLGISSNNTDNFIVRIISDRVGIRSTSPAALLHVGNGTTYNNTMGIKLQQNTRIYESAAGILEFDNFTTMNIDGTTLSVDATGNDVSIGDSLYVGGNADFDGIVSVNSGNNLLSVDGENFPSYYWTKLGYENGDTSNMFRSYVEPGGTYVTELYSAIAGTPLELAYVQTSLNAAGSGNDDAQVTLYASDATDSKSSSIVVKPSQVVVTSDSTKITGKLTVGNDDAISDTDPEDVIEVNSTYFPAIRLDDTNDPTTFTRMAWDGAQHEFWMLATDGADTSIYTQDAHGSFIMENQSPTTAVSLQLRNKADTGRITVSSSGLSLGTSVNTSYTFKDNGLLFDNTPESDHQASGTLLTMTNGNAGAVAFGDVCYVAADGHMEFADADASATMPGLYMAVESISAASSGLWLRTGIARDDTWNWTPGSFIYISTTGTTGNTLTANRPAGTGDQVQIVGVALTADIIDFNPQFEISEIP